MAFNIRKSFERKKDKELALVYARAQELVTRVDKRYRKGEVSLEMAHEASDSVEIATVAAAVIRGRVESGSEDSHRELRNTNVQISPKKLDRGWGEWLRRRRV